MKKLLFFGFLVWGLGLAATEIILVKEGCPRGEIVLRERATLSAQMAALELNEHLLLLTGTTLPVVTQKTGKYPLVIELGTKEKAFTQEYSAVEVQPGRIRLYGYDAPFYGKVDYKKHKTFPIGSTGTLFAVYDFLEQFCGIRWYAPGPDGVVYDPVKTLAVKAGKSRIVSKTTEFRRLSPMPQRYPVGKFFNCDAREMRLFEMRWRTFEYSPGDHHNIYPIYYEHYAPARRDPELRKIFKGRKREYFAHGYDGVMAPVDKYVRREYPGDANLPPGICFSHPGPVKYFARMAKRKFDGEKIAGLPRPYTPRLPGRTFFATISHMDATSLCRCDLCRKRLAAGENIQWQFIADVAREAARIDPRIHISSGAYQERSPYPANVEFPVNTGVSIPLGVHAWWNPEFRKIQYRDIYSTWRRHFGGKRMTVWLYLFGPSWDSLTRYKHKWFPGLYPRMLGKIVREMANDGIRGCMLEVELEQNTLEAYIACMSFYNPAFDADKAIDEYFKKYYREAAPEMRAFYQEIESAYCNWKNYPKEMFGANSAAEKQRLNSLGSGMLTADRNWSVGTDQRMERLKKLFNAAEKKASGVVKRRLKLVRRAFWDQAVQGEKEHKMRLLNKKTPGKCVTIPRLPEAHGDPDLIAWDQAVSLGDCHLITTGKVIPDAFLFRMAADKKFLYMELIDRRKIIGREKWDNFLEVFLSKDGQMPVAQLGFGVGWQGMLAWKTQLINDVLNVSGVPPKEVYGAGYVLKNDKEFWHWRAAFSLEKLFGSSNIESFKLNYRRKNEEARLCWNRFFASSQDCLDPDIMGTVLIRDLNAPEYLPFAEKHFRNEIGTWRMLDGYLRFSGKKNEAAVRLTGRRDGLLALAPVPVRKNARIKVCFKADKPLRVTLLPVKGNKKISGKTQLAKKQKDGSWTAVFAPLVQGDTFSVMLSSPKAVEVCVSDVRVEFQR